MKSFVQLEIRPPKIHPRLPDFLRKPQTRFEPVEHLKRNLRRLSLNTVCESARCPNLHECFHHGTATFMILGSLCTRNCGFCSVPKAPPARELTPPDAAEPANVARMASALRLSHVVITSVNRDELPDGGAGHFAETVRCVRQALPEAGVEVLTPDFLGRHEAVARVLDSEPSVFNHNMETVERLYPGVRPQARYRRSLEVLTFARQYRPATLIKSGVMVGLGERSREIDGLLEDLRGAGVDIVTIGQYLQPTRRNLPVVEFIAQNQYERWKQYGLALGFKMVFAGPFVRSSYMAEQVSREARGEEPSCHAGI